MYSYDIMMSNINFLTNKYPFLSLGYIGNTVLRRPIPFLRLGIGKKEVFYSASFHANEWITSMILMKFIEDFCEAYTNNSTLYDYNCLDIFNNCSIYIVPMVNPDGVDLVNGFLSPHSDLFLQARKIATDYPNISFPSGWKSNINGVDLKNYQQFCKVL